MGSTFSSWDCVTTRPFSHSAQRKDIGRAMRLEQWLKELEVERNRVYPKVLNQDVHLLGRGPQSYLASSLIVFHGVEAPLGTS